MTLALLDAWRLETRERGAPWTEWQHFLVQLPDLHLLVNFSWGQEQALGRLIVIAWDGAWAGDVEVFRGGRVGIVRGRVDARLGRSHMRFDGSEYHVRIAMDCGAVAADLRFTPRSPAIPSYNLRLAQRPMSWVQMPRLTVSGRVSLGGRTHTLRSAPAYHDHNWGRFRWSDDFAWEWGTISPEDAASPWSFALLRTTDRGRRRLHNQVLYAFRDGRLVRFFQPEQLRVHSPGHLEPDDVFTVPRAAGLLLPPALGDLPASMTFEAQAGDDQITLEVTGRRLARIVIPQEDGVGAVVMNQVFVHGRAHGTLAGECLEMEGSGVVEMIRGQRMPFRTAPIPARTVGAEPGSLASLLARALDRIDAAHPEHCAAVFGALGTLRVRVEAGEESFGFRAGAIDDAAEHDVAVTLDRSALRDLLAGRVTLEQSIRRRRIDARGPVSAVLALHRTMVAFVHATLRTPGLDDLHRELMEEAA